METHLRILCVADEYPWPATNGYRIRLANVVEALAAVAPVDLFCVVSERADLAGAKPVPPVAVDRSLVVHRRPFGPSIRGMVRWVRSGWPRAVAWRDWAGAARALEAWSGTAYDAVWFSHADCWLALRGLVAGPAIVDFDNLEDQKLLGALALEAATGGAGVRPPGIVAAVRRRFGRALDRFDARRWTAAQLRIAAGAERVVVCSELDRQRLGCPAAAVVPNGYDAPIDAAAPPRTAPVLTMVGFLTYPPNRDGARLLATEVLPRVRRHIHDAEVRLVGRNDGSLADLAGEPGVTVVGEVDDVGPELETSAVVVVPVRFGGGTRIKVLEGFAHRLPVVTTTVGCEGIDVVPGQHAEVADTADGLAMATVRLLSDTAHADAIAAAGHDLWRDKYRWGHIREQIGVVVHEVAGPVRAT